MIINVISSGPMTLNLKKVKSDIGPCKKIVVLSSILDKYRNHPIIVEFHKNRNLQSTSISILSFSWGSKIMPKEIKIILKSLNSQKVPGIDKIPTELVKLALAF